VEVEDIAITARTGIVRLHGNRPRPTESDHDGDGDDGQGGRGRRRDALPPQAVARFQPLAAPLTQVFVNDPEFVPHPSADLSLRANEYADNSCTASKLSHDG
jgi:hypothetical protein